ncbi:DegT/DnrJ/EryC1/StrS family aminotransferase [Streptomyces rimosus]|uniref:DegT/DnrJ/EryC1/StrS family aminotransferase n=1 Tax=Streptomyces rimosus TaxID=1927 RepID=UPI00067C27A1|nr:DegT/DnrJ/EryC1/StrS family aminotransferase [Streptomyces rimosus]
MVLRVLHLLTWTSSAPRTGPGPLDQVLRLARALADVGVTGEIVAATTRRPGEEASTASHHPGVTVVEFPWVPPEDPAGCLQTPAELAEGLSAGLRALLGRVADFNFVHAHDPVFAPQLAAMARSLTGTPFLTSSQEFRTAGEPGTLAHRLLRANDYGAALLVPHTEARDQLTAVACATPVLVVPPGIDTTGPPEAASDGCTADEVLYAGPPQDTVHLPALLTALSALRPGMRLRTVGGEPLPGPVMRRTALVVAAGTLAEHTRAWVLTAAASGIPVIAADCDGAADALGPGYPGLLPLPLAEMPVRRVVALAEQLLGTGAARKELDEVRARIVGRYGWGAVADRHREIYESVAHGRSPRADPDPYDRVPMAPPDVTDRDVRAAGTALLSGRLTAGHEVESFEREFADWHGVRHAVTVNSATSALFAVLSCAGVRGEVLVPSFTWAATANAVVAAGAVPVWVDIDPDTLGMSPRSAAAAIGPRTEAVLCVHYAGHPCRVAELSGLCERHGLLLVEDSAEAAGARQGGRLTGTFGTGCFSFYPTKNMTTGEGGMVLTDDPGLASGVRTLRAHGMRPVPGSPYPWRKEAVVAGFNFRMPEPLAAVGRRQLERLTGMNERRRAVAALLDSALADFGDRVRPHGELPGFHHVYQMYVIRLADPSIRDGLVAGLRAAGVEASVHFDPPVHRHRFYRERYPAGPAKLPVTDDLARRVVTLPMHARLTDRAALRIASSLGRALGTGVTR